jgi:hypothetical protein
VTVEVEGQKTAWERHALAGRLPDAPPGAVAKSFAVAQDSDSGTISLALVVTASNADVLSLRVAGQLGR